MAEECICKRCYFYECCPDAGDCEDCSDYTTLEYIDEDDALMVVIEEERYEYRESWHDYCSEHDDDYYYISEVN